MKRKTHSNKGQFESQFPKHVFISKLKTLKLKGMSIKSFNSEVFEVFKSKTLRLLKP